MTSTAHSNQYNDNQAGEPRLYLALELSAKTWKMGFSVGLGHKPRIRSMVSGDGKAFDREVERARRRFQVPEARVMSCYEAGRDGFWVHRWLKARGVDNLVLDSSSIEVNRRARRAKSDRLDVDGLLRMLIRYGLGEKKVFRAVRVPSRQEEDRRQLHRETKSWKKEQTRIKNRVRSLLACQGIRVGRIEAGLSRRLEAIRDWSGEGLAPGLRRRIARLLQQLGWIGEQIGLLQRQCREELKQADSEEAAKVRQLMRIKGVGLTSAWILEHEFFSWREIRNGRQLGSLAGLTPTPYQSGESHREQGISKAGNRHVRAVMIQLGWLWLRYQPDSHLSQWFLHRFERGGPRTRKKGIVALSRRLLIQLWRFRETGELPPGALLTAESAH